MITFLQIVADSVMHKFTTRAYNWVIGYTPKVILAVLVFIVGELIIRLINKGLKKILSGKRLNATLRPFIQNLAQITLQVLLILLVMQLLGIQMTLFAAVIGAFGVAIGLALSGTLQNFAGGFLIILLKPFSVGENIITQGEAGTVIAIRIFYTVIRTFNNTTLIVPNSKLSNEIIFNLTREKERRLDIVLKLKYDVDYEKIKQTVLQVIDGFDSCLKKEATRIGIEKLEEDGFVVNINVWTDSHGFQDTKLKFNEALLAALLPFLSPTKKA